MSVQTRVDDDREKLKMHLKEARKLCANIFDPDTWGHSDMSVDWMDNIIHMHTELIRMNNNV